MAEQEPAEAAQRKDSILSSLVPQRCHRHFSTNNFRLNPFVLIKKHMFIFRNIFSERSTEAVTGYSLSFAMNLSIRKLKPGEDQGTSTSLGAGTSNSRAGDVARLEDEIRELEQRYRSKVDELSRLR